MSKNPGVPPIDGQDSEAESRHVVKQEEAFSDQFFYCEICQQPFIDECVIHGPPLFTLDSPTPLGLPQRALLTLPHGLVIGRSSLPSAGLGVFNQGQTIRLGMHFGPLDGEVTSGEEVLDQAASWIIYRGNDQCNYIDTGKDTHSNWMRFVVCSRSELEQNLVAFQQNGQIWFRCCRPINPGEEFRVWYSEEYARAVTTLWDEIWKMKCTLLGQTHETGKQECPCSFCHHSFPTPFYLRLHVKRSHPDVSADSSQNQMLVLGEEPHLLSSDPSQPGTESSQDPDASSQPRETYNAVDVSVQCGTSLSDASDPDVLSEVNKCSQCDQNFQRSCHLKRHQRTIHSKEKPYCCSHCGKCFSQSTGLKRHQRVHQRQEESEGNAEESIQCSTSLLNKLDFSQHVKEKHLGKRLRSITAVTEEDADKHDPPYKPSALRQRSVKSQNGQTKKVPSGRPRGRPQKSKCVVSDKRQTESCDLSLTDSAQQKSPHLEKELEEPQNVCGECLKDFASIDLLRAHECFKSGSEFHICPHCKICFYQVSSLHRHELFAHSKEKPYCCTMCPKSFTQSSDLKRHQRIHSRRKTCRQTSALANAAIYPCTYCPFSFIGERYLHKHMRRHHPEMSMKYLSSLDGGVMSAERPHSCSQCCKSFSTIKGFKNHSCFKQGEKVYLCPDCGKAFGWLNSLKQHQRIHTGEKPYTCQQCGKSFVHSGQLNVHLRTHTGEKPFLCSQCGESFRQSGDLRRHEQKHSGVRPCQCLDCGKSFSRPQSLKAHQQLHEGTKLFPCTQCGKSFTRRYHLTRHNQKMHS